VRKPWRRKKNLIFSALSGADATEHFNVFVIEGNEMINEDDEFGAWSRSSTNSLSSSQEGVLYVSIPYATAVHNAFADAA
jgi:hypothetical protein